MIAAVLGTNTNPKERQIDNLQPKEKSKQFNYFHVLLGQEQKDMDLLTQLNSVNSTVLDPTKLEVSSMSSQLT